VNESLPTGVLTELRRLEARSVGVRERLLVLAGTACVSLVVAWSHRKLDWVDLPLLGLALLLHDVGHLAAMRAFGWFDPGVLFLPMLASGARGKRGGGSHVERAMVALAGPAPSLLLAITLLLVGWLRGAPLDGSSDEILPRFALLLATMNLFALLPLEPLDGGAFLREMPLGRVPALRVVSNVFTAAVLATWAVMTRSWLAVVPAAAILSRCWSDYQLVRSAMRLRGDLRGRGAAAKGDIIPDAHVGAVGRRVRVDLQVAGLPIRARATAASMRAIWQLAQKRSPRWARLAAVLAVSCALALPVAALTAWTAWALRPHSRNGDVGVPRAGQLPSETPIR
jgi:Zn-dependent protease